MLPGVFFPSSLRCWKISILSVVVAEETRKEVMYSLGFRLCHKIPFSGSVCSENNVNFQKGSCDDLCLCILGNLESVNLGCYSWGSLLCTVLTDIFIFYHVCVCVTLVGLELTQSPT